MVLFSELHFTWSTGMDAQSLESYKDEVSCCIGSPSLHILETPVSIRIRNQSEIDRVVQY
jgi:hypothetical protein